MIISKDIKILVKEGAYKCLFWPDKNEKCRCGKSIDYDDNGLNGYLTKNGIRIALCHKCDLIYKHIFQRN